MRETKGSHEIKKTITRDQERFDETMFSILHTLKHVGNRFKRKEEGGG